VGNVTLPQELKRFVTEAITDGRYRDVLDVVAVGVRLLQRREQDHAELLASVPAAKDASDRYPSGDELGRARAGGDRAQALSQNRPCL